MTEGRPSAVLPVSRGADCPESRVGSSFAQAGPYHKIDLAEDGNTACRGEFCEKPAGKYPPINAKHQGNGREKWMVL